jgi:hypothetical protein
MPMVLIMKGFLRRTNAVEEGCSSFPGEKTTTKAISSIMKDMEKERCTMKTAPHTRVHGKEIDLPVIFARQEWKLILMEIDMKEYSRMISFATKVTTRSKMANKK